MSSQSMVVTSVLLMAVWQTGFCADSIHGPTVVKDYRHSTLVRASLHQSNVMAKPVQADKRDFLEPRMEPRESRANGPEGNVRDSNEQFTRMSCCP